MPHHPTHKISIILISDNNEAYQPLKQNEYHKTDKNIRTLKIEKHCGDETFSPQCSTKNSALKTKLQRTVLKTS
jgi:hypothetical protein